MHAYWLIHDGLLYEKRAGLIIRHTSSMPPVDTSQHTYCVSHQHSHSMTHLHSTAPSQHTVPWPRVVPFNDRSLNENSKEHTSEAVPHCLMIVLAMLLVERPLPLLDSYVIRPLSYWHNCCQRWSQSSRLTGSYSPLHDAEDCSSSDDNDDVDGDDDDDDEEEEEEKDTVWSTTPIALSLSVWSQPMTHGWWWW